MVTVLPLLELDLKGMVVLLRIGYCTCLSMWLSDMLSEAPGRSGIREPRTHEGTADDARVAGYATSHPPLRREKESTARL